MRELAELFEKGAPGVPVDSGRALALYERHNRMDDQPTWGLIRAGVLLRDAPPGVTRDEARAVAHFERAAGFGNPVAARDLALMLRDGRGAPKDEARAFTLLERAVADGDESALLRLGEMFAAGRGVAQDVEKARALFEEAERKRVKGSRDALRALNRR
jgi:TPR repeat protein